MPFFTSNGANIHVDVAGAGAPLLMIHSLTLDHRQWSAQREALLQEHRVFRMDLRGHGRSAATTHGHTWSGFAQDVQRAMVQVGMERLHPGFLVAHAHAADAVLQAALAEPRSLRAVVVVAPVVSGCALSEAWRERMRRMRQHAAAGELESALELFRADPVFAGVRAQADLEAGVRDMQARFSGAFLYDDDDAGTPTLERLADCKVPILVVRPQRDRADLREAASAIAARAPRARVVECAAVGHFANLEGPELFNEILRDCIAEHA
ncbi:MAG: alpha/beta fold hydrolase [Candidatus Latescibacterota bacterium]|nr:MAG: alpha/beta fold hydrolase [Candidatus Latescibacterota bacterium]